MLRSAGQEWAGPTRTQRRDSEPCLRSGEVDSVERHTDESRPGCHRFSPTVLKSNMIQQSYSVVAVCFLLLGVALSGCRKQKCHVGRGKKGGLASFGGYQVGEGYCGEVLRGASDACRDD